MSNVIVEGFGVYGFGTGTASGGGIAANLLAGIYAEVSGTVTGFPSSGGCEILAGLPWDASDESYWLRGIGSNQTGRQYTLRRVLPAAQEVFILSFRVALSQLPQENTSTALFDIRDAGNNIMATMFVSTTGALIWNYGGGNTVTTSGPVLVAEAAHHIEVKIDKGSGTESIVAYVDEVKVLDTAIDYTDNDPVAQFTICSAATVSTINDRNYVLITDVIVRDENGAYNANFPVGDRRVATLLVDSDDPGHQGWEPHPLQRFGAGILQLEVSGRAIFTATSLTSPDLGAGDFTLEGQFRFDDLPTGSNAQVLFSKWREDNNTRSYRLFKGGPSLNNGRLVFQTSTDGTTGTVVNKIEWPWEPDVNTYYSIALCRSGGYLMLFIDGIMQGLPILDSDTYFATSARFVLGGQQNNVGGVASTFNGWIDEFRFTKGLSRYSANYAPPTDKFPRGSFDDPDWANVILLTGFDAATVSDDGPLTLSLTAAGGATAITPGDGDAAYETLNKNTPDDNTFIQAALLPAMGVFTLSDLPTAGETVTLGSDVYKFVAALTDPFDVLIGGDILSCIENLIAAITSGDGEGVVYGTGTTINADAGAELLPSGQMLAIANIPGVAGNSIASTTTCVDGAWDDTTLQGGADIPGYSAFGLQPLPRGVTVVDSITLVTRQWKTDAGTAQTRVGFEGPGGANDYAAARPISTNPTFYMDTFEEDPDLDSVLTPNAINNGKVRIDRTV